MRPGLGAIGVAAVALLGGAAFLFQSGGPEPYRVAVVFDSAKGMVAGQQVKIAGAPVGTVEEIGLAPGPKARMVLEVSGSFAPFREDATCTILPQGLISENFVDCEPGSSGPPLEPGSEGLPTVPVEATTVPVSLQDVINVFSLPTNVRLRALINELGLATAGRGEDINEILRRANPALLESRQVLEIVNAERRELGGAVADTDQLLADLGARDDDVRAFVANAADVAETTADHRGSLSETIRRLPAMLQAVRPGLESLDRATAEATPLLADLREAVPNLTNLTRTLPDFIRQGRPAVDAVGAVARRGRPAVRAATPVVEQLRRSLGQLAPFARSLDRVLVSLRDTGGIEGILRIGYAFATNTAMHDDLSHVLAFTASVAPECIAGQQAERDVEGCSRKYSAKGRGQIPLNQPSCGPKDSSWWNEMCKPPQPGPFVTQTSDRPTKTKNRAGSVRDDLVRLNDRVLSGENVDRARYEPLLDFLLK